jgi:hypothetical protein
VEKLAVETCWTGYWTSCTSRRPSRRTNAQAHAGKLVMPCTGQTLLGLKVFSHMERISFCVRLRHGSMHPQRLPAGQKFQNMRRSAMAPGKVPLFLCVSWGAKVFFSLPFARSRFACAAPRTSIPSRQTTLRQSQLHRHHLHPRFAKDCRAGEREERHDKHLSTNFRAL